MRRSLLNFIGNLSSAPGGYKAGWVHKLICAKLERFAKDIRAGRSPRLMLFMPPRTGKSEIASKMFPAWYLGHNPNHELIACSYAVALPMDFSRKIKEVLQSKTYEHVFPRARLDRNAKAAEGWKTTEGGAYVAAGVSGPITGKGAHCLIIDDPVKDAEEADSETVRQKTWDWYGSTARTRLAPGGGILLIMTRWHDDDLAGKLLRVEQELRKEIEEEVESASTEQERDEAMERYKTLENWEVVDLKALAESDEWWDKRGGGIVYEPPSTKRAQKSRVLLRKKGEALHPDRFDRVSLLKIRNTLQPRHWSALYQQNPTPDEGSHFTRDMLRFVPNVPSYEDMTVLVAWDLAIGQRQSNDFTVGAVGGLSYTGDLFLLEVIRGRMTSQDIAETVVDVGWRYSASVTGIERGQLELAVRPLIDAEMKRKKHFITLTEGREALVPITDKVTRSRPLQGLMQQGKVHLPQDQMWTETVVGELLRFPHGVYDDCVDALSWLARLATRTMPPRNPVEELRKRKPPSWKDKLRNMQGRKNWRAA
jgi:predicted phage terminase large subunit-like protein